MSAAAIFMPELAPHRSGVDAQLADAIMQVATSERALDDLIGFDQRMHRSNIQHDPQSCLVCFGAA